MLHIWLFRFTVEVTYLTKFVSLAVFVSEKKKSIGFSKTNTTNKRIAPGEARTHGLQIMRLTRCLLRYGGLVKAELRTKFFENF